MSKETFEEWLKAFEELCKKSGGRYEPYRCKIDIEGVKLTLGVITLLPVRNIMHAQVYLPLTPTYELSSKGYDVFRSKVSAYSLKHEKPERIGGTIRASVYSEIRSVEDVYRTFDKLVSALREIGREWKTLYGE